jgi:hypothetical protein
VHSPTSAMVVEAGTVRQKSRKTVTSGRAGYANSTCSKVTWPSTCETAEQQSKLCYGGPQQDATAAPTRPGIHPRVGSPPSAGVVMVATALTAKEVHHSHRLSSSLAHDCRRKLAGE